MHEWSDLRLFFARLLGIKLTDAAPTFRVLSREEERLRVADEKEGFYLPEKHGERYKPPLQYSTFFPLANANFFLCFSAK